MKYLRLSLQFFVLLCVSIAKSETPKGMPYSEEDFAAKEVRDSLQRYAETLAEINSMPPDEAIPKLSEIMARTLRWQNEKSLEIYKSAQQKLLSIPGHAKYFTDKVDAEWESTAESVRKLRSVLPTDWEKQPPDSEISKSVAKALFELAPWRRYSEVCSKNLGMLGHIPSTESVRALGRYLRNRDETGLVVQSPGTWNLAAESLTELISDGPMHVWMASAEDVPKWQQWFDEVKAGKRTFRFVGSDMDYTLDGPATKERLEKIAKDRKRTENHRKGKNGATEKGGSSSDGMTITSGIPLVALIASGFAVLASAVWYLRRARK